MTESTRYLMVVEMAEGIFDILLYAFFVGRFKCSKR